MTGLLEDLDDEGETTKQAGGLKADLVTCHMSGLVVSLLRYKSHE